MIKLKFLSSIYNINNKMILQDQSKVFRVALLKLTSVFLAYLALKMIFLARLHHWIIQEITLSVTGFRIAKVLEEMLNSVVQVADLLNKWNDLLRKYMFTVVMNLSKIPKTIPILLNICILSEANNKTI